jgi:D-alanyl-D-alanine carboxypeptidase
MLPARDLQLRLSADVSNTMKKWHPPGISVAVVLRDGRVLSVVRGLERLDRRTPVTTTSVFSAGSITKTFIAAAVLRLVEERRLRLDNTIRRWLPGVPSSDKITIRDLLAHTSGLAWDSGSWDSWFRDVVGHPDVAVPTNDPLRHKPYVVAPAGTGFRYGNGNYELLAQIIERVTGQQLSTVIRSRFIGPLKLDRTFVQPDEEPPPPIAHGYALHVGNHFAEDFVDTKGPVSQSDYADVAGAKDYVPSLRITSLIRASGAMASTATDLARWAGASWGGTVLDRSSTSAMLAVSAPSTQKHSPPGFDGYGLGVVRTTVGGQTLWDHAGGITGFQSLVGYVPEQQVSFAIMVNTSRDALIVGELAQAILRSLGINARTPIVA